MVQHMIIWQFRDSMTAEEKKAQAVLIKENLEGLKGQIPGLISITVQTEFVKTANGDLMLLSSFEDVAALQGYSKSPIHNKVADTYVRPYMQSRHCMDFEV